MNDNRLLCYLPLEFWAKLFMAKFKQDARTWLRNMFQ